MVQPELFHVGCVWVVPSGGTCGIPCRERRTGRRGHSDVGGHHGNRTCPQPQRTLPAQYVVGTRCHCSLIRSMSTTHAQTAALVLVVPCPSHTLSPHHLPGESCGAHTLLVSPPCALSLQTAPLALATAITSITHGAAPQTRTWAPFVPDVPQAVLDLNANYHVGCSTLTDKPLRQFIRDERVTKWRPRRDV